MLFTASINAFCARTVRPRLSFILNLSANLAKITEDSLVYDQMTFEIIRNRRGAVQSFVATAHSAGASFGVNGLFIVCASVLLAYYAISIMFKNKSIRIGEIKFHIPSFGVSMVQTILGIMDALCAGLVLYFCITPYIDLPFGVFIGLYVIAMVAGVFSQVPGGIGVFESVFMVALPETADKASIFGALLAYRIIYYVLPLIGVGGLFFIYERWLRARMKRWLEEAKQKIPHIQLPHKKHES